MTRRVAVTEPLMADHRGVAIASRPRCRGVWLDRGKPSKIVERCGTATWCAGRQKETSMWVTVARLLPPAARGSPFRPWRGWQPIA